MMNLSDTIKQWGYQVKAMLQNNVYIFRDDGEMVVVPLNDLSGKSPEEMKAIIEQYFHYLKKHDT